MPPHRAWRRPWLVAGLVLPAVTAAAVYAGLPAAFMFGGLVAGFVASAVTRHSPEPPRQARLVAMAIIGTVAGSYVDGEVLAGFAVDVIPVTIAVAATFAATLVTGQILRIGPGRRLDGTTVTLASVAGGATGMVAVAREYDADPGVVAAAQYLRVLLVVGSMPVVLAVAFTEPTQGGGAAAPSTWGGLAFTVLAGGVGLALAQVASFAAAPLLFSLLASAGLALAWPGHDPVPAAASAAALVVIGLSIGGGIAPRQLRALRALLPLMVLQAVLGILACAAIGVALARATGASLMDAYLATVPGGLPAITAIATSAGADVTFVLSVQTLRVLCVFGLVPAIAFGLAWRGRRRREPPEGHR